MQIIAFFFIIKYNKDVFERERIMKNVHETEIKFEKEWGASIDKAFKEVSKDLKIDGFRKGKITKEMYIAKFGIESLFNEAINILLNDNLEKVNHSDDVVSVVTPKIDVTEVDKDKITIKVTKISAPEVKLGEYKNLGITKEEVKVSAKEVTAEIENILKEHVDYVITDKEVKNGDIAVIDFSGEVDGEILEGGTGFDYELEIGSNSFIPGFEEKLIGAKTGEERILDLKFPMEYHEHLKGKDVKFTVTIKEVKIKRLPEINKELFEDLGIEVETEEEFKKFVKGYIKEQKEQEAKKAFENAVFDKAVENMKVEINDEIIEEEVDIMRKDMEMYMSKQGMNLSDYLRMINYEESKFMDSLKADAVKKIKFTNLLKKVAEVEKIKYTDEEFNKYKEEYLNSEDFAYLKGFNDQEKINSHIDFLLVMDKTQKFIVENN